ncbi:MAG TPA: hypothetical protein ENK84_00365 [Desulfobulbus sp.]|nr:hypothetical protein [Desulfobulbus sp.]
MDNAISVDDFYFPEKYPPPNRANRQSPQEMKGYSAGRKRLHGWLEVIRRKPDFSQPVAVFDFDGTCIFNDIGKAVFEFQLDHFLFRHHIESFAALFPQWAGALDGIPMAKIREQLIGLYRELSSLTSKRIPAITTLRPAWKKFKVLFLWYINAARRNPLLGPEYTLTLLTRLLAGYTVAEVGRMTIQALQKALDANVGEVIHSIRFAPPIGTISVTMHQGIRVYPEMIDLMTGLNESGIRCVVISASSQWVVEHALEYLGFPVEREDVYGIRVKLNEQGVLKTCPADDYPITYRMGKRQVLENLVSGTPILVAGDAETDYEMLTMPVPVRFIIDHGGKGLIRELINTPGYLVQAVDRRKGAFRSSGEKPPIQSVIIAAILQKLLQSVQLAL